MKIVSGKVVSTHPISLSKAAKLISRFTASDNEATPAFAAYLRGTSAAFNELVNLHKEFQISVDDSPTKKPRSRDGKREGVKNEIENRKNVADLGDVKTKKKKGSDGSYVNEVKNETGSVNGSEEMMKKKKKRDKRGEENRDGIVEAIGKNAEQKDDKNGVIEKKQSHEVEERENVRTIKTEEATDKKASRKRKHETVADGELDGSHEAVKAKKKKMQLVG